MPQGADLKQLPGLGLYAFCRIDDHDGGIGGHEGTVGILGEVLVARCVEDVDAVAVIAELEYGGRDGNTTLLLNLHPVGRSRFLNLITLYRTRYLNLSSKKQ